MHGFKHIRSKRDEIKPTSSTSKREGRCKLRNLCLILVEFSYNKICSNQEALVCTYNLNFDLK